MQCIYIDPPFNTGTNEFLYKNKYLDSSWISMMYDRLGLGRKLLKDDGGIYVRIDYHGNYYVRSLMDIIFGEENFRNEVLVNRTQKAFEGANRLITANDSLFLHSKCDRFSLNPIKKRRNSQKWIPMHSPGIRWTKVSREYLAFYDSAQLIKKRGEYYSQGRVFNNKVYMPPNGRHWTFTQERLETYAQEKRIRENPKAGILEYLTSLEANLDSNWLDIPGYVVPPRWDFQTENSEILLKRVIESTSKDGDLILDYFLGSGTTTAVAQKLGRKWIGVEMGEFFEHIPLKRMKKVLFGEKSGISKEVNWQGGGFFKYQYFEQYEDTLHNIEFPNEGKAQQMLKLFGEEEASEYLMKYMLKFETDGSSSFLNLKQFENPFDYKLRIISGGKGEKIADIDLIETFNYLAGLKVSKYSFLNENRRKYVFALGERNSRGVAVIWRATRDINLEKDKAIIEGNIKSFHPNEIFINGDSLVKGYKPIESEFKTLMAR
jgi:Adenine specific DNA methylase Mod